MLVEFPYGHRYLLSALAGAPEVLSALLKTVPASALDHRSDPDRFTPREVLAHLADWEDVYRERIEKMLAEDRPVLPNYDEGAWAVERSYGSRDPGRSLAEFQSKRLALVQRLDQLDDEAWQRRGVRPEIGELTVEALVFLIVTHDAYHQRQLAAPPLSAGERAGG
ncbi:MAG TPA: DinB family protein [Fimbriimonadaceae bacterium]|nr:DinB family protein [Fimbriimonadaceae bacterium]